MDAVLTSRARRSGKEFATQRMVKAQLERGEHVHVAGAGATHCGGVTPRCKETRPVSEWLSR